MKILVLGSDGYIGWPLTLHLLDKGHNVACLDNGSRRVRVKALGSNSLTPIVSRFQRGEILESYENFFKGHIDFNLHVDSSVIGDVLDVFKPHTIVHLAEQPSAPWSMKSPIHAVVTQKENVLGTLNLLWAMKRYAPDAHLVKLGTMGEYGTPDCDIPEGKIPEECLGNALFSWVDNEGDLEGESPIHCRMQGLPFPRSPGSFYHLSKVHDTHNIIFACKTWGLKSTDIMQGVVFGLMGEGDRVTRFDYDECFGTVINRFIVQAIIEHPLTVYGKGEQIRGFIRLDDSIQCLTLAIENPPDIFGTYRTFNQFEETYSINLLADMVRIAADREHLRTEVRHIDNPRYEHEEHYYNPTNQKLLDLGYKPTKNIQREIDNLVMMLRMEGHRVIKSAIMPTTTWR